MVRSTLIYAAGARANRSACYVRSAAQSYRQFELLLIDNPLMDIAKLLG